MKKFRVISFNANGIRSAANKGFFSWLQTQNADVVCLQEVKAHVADLKDSLFFPEGYYCTYVNAKKKGYSGVAIFSKKEPEKIITTLGYHYADEEARYVEAQFSGGLHVASLYLPSGTSGEERQAIKYRFMHFYEAYLKKVRQQNKPFIICGDWNIAHKNIDLKNWRSNQNNSGFLPEERAWLDKLFNEIGLVDAFRVVNQEPDQYTWWTMRVPHAWEKNIGWRIDYQIVTPILRDKIKHAMIYRGEKFSDHAPLIIDYEL